MKRAVQVQTSDSANWRSYHLEFDEVGGTLRLTPRGFLRLIKKYRAPILIRPDDLAAVSVTVGDDPNGALYALGLLVLISTGLTKLAPGIDDTWLEPFSESALFIIGALAGMGLGKLNKVPVLALSQVDHEPDMAVEQLRRDIRDILDLHAGGEVDDAGLKSFIDARDISAIMTQRAHEHPGAAMKAASRLVPSINARRDYRGALEFVGRLLDESHESGLYITGTVWQGPGGALTLAEDVTHLLEAHRCACVLPERPFNAGLVRQARARSLLLLAVSLGGLAVGLVLTVISM